MSIFSFNHIDKNKIKEEIQIIKELINITTLDIGVTRRRINILRN